MFAVIAAVLFALALLFELIRTDLGTVLTPTTFTTAGLLFLALHFTRATAWRPRSYRRR